MKNQFVLLLLLSLIPSLLNAQNHGTGIVKEDFSKFIDGSEERPDVKDLADYYTSAIAETYTLQPGWFGAGIYSAGGACHVSMYEDDYGTVNGYLNTPKCDFSGVLTYSFRAKLKGEKCGEMYMTVDSKTETLPGVTIALTPEWQTFTGTFIVESTKVTKNTTMQFSAQDGVSFLLDDVIISRESTLLEIPKAKPYTDFSRNSFTANWEAVEGATDYFVDVYAQTPSGVDTVLQKFDNLNLDENNRVVEPNLPDGIILDLSRGGGAESAISAEDCYTVPGAIYFNATGDAVMTPNRGQKLLRVIIWGKAENPEKTKSLMRIEQYVGSDWKPLGDITADKFSGGKFAAVDRDIDPNATRLKLSLIEAGGGLYLDNMTIIYRPIPDYHLRDHRVTATFCKVEGIDPEKDYYYRVKAVSGTSLSSPSEEIFVDALLAPESKPAEDVTENGFTAVWEKTPKADGYVLHNYKVYTAKASGEYTILTENFSKVLGESSPESPESLPEETKMLDNYTSLPGWLGRNNVKTGGMLGGKGWGASVQLPPLTLSNAAGRFRLFVRAWMAKPDDLVIQYGEGKDKKTTRWVFEKAGFGENAFILEGGGNHELVSIGTFSGVTFLLDSVEISQALDVNDSFSLLRDNLFVRNGNTINMQFRNIAEPGYSFKYNLFAYRIINDGLVVSKHSQTIPVTLALSAIEAIPADGYRLWATSSGDGLLIRTNESGEVRLYGSDGMLFRVIYVEKGLCKKVSCPRGFYILKHSDGTVAKVFAG